MALPLLALLVVASLLKGGLQNGEHLSDWLTLLVTTIAAIVALTTLYNQKVSNDVGRALTVFYEINRYWDRAQDQDKNTFKYNIGQILSNFELASHMFNTGILSAGANTILKQHILDVLEVMISNQSSAELLASYKSNEENFSELKKFVANHGGIKLNTWITNSTL